MPSLVWACQIAPLLTALAAPPAPDQPPGSPLAKIEVIRVNAQRGADCPTADQVTSAINARLPGMISDSTATDGGKPARLVLTQLGPNATRVELISAGGAPVLERTLELLAPEEPGKHADGNRGTAACAALADTISLIVQRYLRHLEYRDETPATAPIEALVRAPPPAPPSARRGLRALLIGAVGDVGGPFGEPSGASVWTPGAGLGVELAWMRLALSAQATVGTTVKAEAIPDSDGGTFTYMPVALRAAAGWRLPVAKGTLAPTLGGGVDLLFETVRGLRATSGGSFSAEPVLEGGANYTLPLGAHGFVAAHSFAVLNLRPHDFQVIGLPSSVLRTPRAYARAGLSFGAVFDVQGGASKSR
ncbi:MAG TPA: hypothetical protein VH374_26485 [Polyangia bacterium]|nr:hypothetical protein [Polyangia bacterium]